MGTNARDADDELVLSALLQGPAARLRLALPWLATHFGQAALLRNPHGVARARPRTELARLVVVEGGGSGPETHTAGPRQGRHQVAIVTQNTGELPGALARRAVRRILGFEQSHCRVERVVLLLAPRFDAETTAARVLVARALMTHSAAAGSPASELVLDAGNEPTDGHRLGLLRLADALRAKPGSAALPIQILFAKGGTLVPAVATITRLSREPIVAPCNEYPTQGTRRDQSDQRYLATMVDPSQGDVGQHTARQVPDGRGSETDER